MATNFNSQFVPSVGTNSSVVYGPVARNTQAIVFGLSAANLLGYPVTATFYVNTSRPTLTSIIVSAITNTTQLVVNSVAGLAVNTIISPTAIPNTQTITAISAGPAPYTITVGGSTSAWIAGSSGVISTLYTWSRATNINLLYKGVVPVGSSLVALGSDRKMALQGDAIVYATASVDNSIDVVCSYLEIT